MSLQLKVTVERWSIDGSFTIARGTRTHAEVVVAQVRSGPHLGWGEAIGVSYHGEDAHTCEAELLALPDHALADLQRERLYELLPPGGARNALDCALWDLEAKQSGVPVWERAGLPKPGPLVTAYTISLAAPQVMAEKAARHRERPLLKVKLGKGAGDVERIRAVREAAPDSRLIVDANEGWTRAQLDAFAPDLHAVGVELVEQPIARASDDALDDYEGPVPLCADESCQTTADLDGLPSGYRSVNVKLDKTGGLTEAIRLTRAARERGLGVMVGCMVGTSLSMAPAILVAQLADVVDLDGPLLLDDDRSPGLRYAHGRVYPPERTLWG